MASGRKLILVIGAGVAGLQTSISLLQAGYLVCIIAKHFPQDKSIEYASPWAGAHWRSHAAESDLEQQQWDAETFSHWLELIRRDRDYPSRTSTPGLALWKSRFYSASTKGPWYSRTVLSYEPIPEDSLPQGMQHGHKCTSIAVCVPTYLQYLWHIAHSLGALNIKATLPSNGTFSSTLQAAADVLKTHRSSWESTGIPQISAFVNATGLSALNIVPDEDMYPSRGQTVTVAGEANQITTIDGPASADASADAPITYVIPRPHSRTTILGGTRQIGRWDGEPEPATTAEILQEAKKWAPELLDANGEFRVLSVQVGLRPGRKGGARVEMEKVGEFVVCHAYGYGGAGYQNSVGAANKVVRLLGQWFGTEQ